MTLFLTASLVPYECSKEKYNISPAALSKESSWPDTPSLGFQNDHKNTL